MRNALIILAVVITALVLGCSKSTSVQQMPTPTITGVLSADSTFWEVQMNGAEDFEDAEIRYTIDGSEPNENSTLFSNKITITQSTMFKAKIFSYGNLPSITARSFFPIKYNLPYTLVAVAGGTFNNGSSNVTVSGFEIDKYEVTQSYYRAIMGIAPSFFVTQNVNNRPVEQVSWMNAIEFCNRRSIREGYTPCYTYTGFGTDPDQWPVGWELGSNHGNISCNWDANGFRLPTEMEWMFAAKGGTLSLNYTYSGGDTLNYVGWHHGNSGLETKQCGLLEANELGLHDMSGNISEWVWDIHANYPTSNQTDPRGPNSGSTRVIRGGDWGLSDIYAKVDARLSYAPGYKNRHIGFRVCRKV